MIQYTIYQQTQTHLWEEDAPEAPIRGLDICTAAQQPAISGSEFDPFNVTAMPMLSGPLLDKREARRHIQLIERFMGSNRSECRLVADKLISDLRTATQYPPEIVEKQDAAVTIQTIRDLIKHFNTEKAKKATGKK